MTKSFSFCTAQSNNSDHLFSQEIYCLFKQCGSSVFRSLKLTQSSPRVTRFVTYLSEFMFRVRTIPGRFYLADALSRMHCDSSDCATCRQPRRFLSVLFFHDSTPHPVLPTEHKSTQTNRRKSKTEINIAEISAIASLNMADEQKADSDITYLRDRLTDGSLLKSSPAELSALSPRLRKLLIWAPDIEIKK